MLLGGLLDGLIQRSTGAIRRPARRPHRLLGDGREVVPAQPHHPAKCARRSRRCPGVTQRGRHRRHPARCARAAATGPRDLVDVALFGYQRPADGVPVAPAAGRGLRRQHPPRRRRAAGRHAPPRTRRARPVKVVGFVDDVSYSGAGSLWASPATWRDVQNANRPGVVGGTRGVPGARRAHRPRPVVGGRARSTARPAARPQTVSATEAADAIGGVRQQRSVFNQIIGVTLVIADRGGRAVLRAPHRRAHRALRHAEGDRRPLAHALRRRRAPGRRRRGGRRGDRHRRSRCCSTSLLPPGAIPYQLLPSRVIVSSRGARASPRSWAAPSRSAACSASTLRPPSGGPRERHRRATAHRAPAALETRCARCTRPATTKWSRSTTPPSPSVTTRSSRSSARRDRARPPCAPSRAASSRRQPGRVVVAGEDISELLAEAAHRLPSRARRLRVPDRQPRAVPHRPREPARGRRDRSAHRRPGPRAGPTSSSRSSAWPTAATTSRRRSRAASANGSPSAAR